MIKLFVNILFYVVFLGSNIAAQNTTHYFNKTFEAGEGHYITPLIDTIDNGYLIISSEHNLINNKSLKLQKIDSLGNIEWYSQLDSIDYNLGLISHDFIKTGDGNYFIYYPKPSLTGYNSDLRLVKVTPTGDILWKKTIGDYAHEFIHQVILTSDGGFLLIGARQVLDPFEYANSYVIKLDSLGDIEWTNTYLLGLDRNIAYTGIEVEDGYVIGAKGKVNGEDQDMVWFKTNEAGELLWEKNYVNSGQDDCGAYIYAYTDSTYLLTGCINDSSPRTPFVVKLDSNFDMIWDSIYYTPYNAHYLSRKPVIKENGDFLTIARHYIPGNIGQPLIMFFDKDGDIEWTKEVTIDSTFSVLLETVKPTPDGGYVFAGYRGTGSQIGWLLKTDSLGNTCSYIGCDSVGVDTVMSSLPSLATEQSRLRLSPNPATDHLLLMHEYPFESGTFSFQLIDVQGTIVKEEKVNEPLIYYRIGLESVPSGLYIYRLVNAHTQEVYESGKVVVKP